MQVTYSCPALFFYQFTATLYVHSGRQLLYIAPCIAAVESIDGIVGSIGYRQTRNASRQSENLQIVDIPEISQSFAARIIAVKANTHVVRHMAREVNGKLCILATLCVAGGIERIIGQTVEQSSPCCTSVAAYIYIVELWIVCRIFVGSRCP